MLGWFIRASIWRSLETGHDPFGVEPSPNRERDGALDGCGTGGPVDGAHAAFAEDIEQPVGPDLFQRRLRGHAERSAGAGHQVERTGGPDDALGLEIEQGRDLACKDGILARQRGHLALTLGLRQLPQAQQQRLQAAVFRGHARILADPPPARRPTRCAIRRRPAHTRTGGRSTGRAGPQSRLP
ncbi:MAG: hypothetical protein R2712_08515 [Vicinamibacterales bacterium]